MTDAPGMMLRLARSFAEQCGEMIHGLDTETKQDMATKLLSDLKLKLDHDNDPRRQFAFYWEQLGGHTHIEVFSGFGEGSRGKAGQLVVTNEEWTALLYALAIIEVLLPGVFVIRRQDAPER